MRKVEACGDTLSNLGFGLMRFPTLADGKIDEEKAIEMIDCAFEEEGVNYFDTAYMYHGGQSELLAGKVLSRYPRDKFRLASKYPGFMLGDKQDPKAIFEEQLKKCQVEYFDYYLLHSVSENSYGIYMSPQWKIIEYFEEQRRLGRIRHFGFSAHASPDTMDRFLDEVGVKIDFCQIQLNYLDWTLQDAKAKYELLTKRNIPVWVMEPLRGGRLANLPSSAKAMLNKKRAELSPVEWAFKWLQTLPNVKVILSGMSTLEQVKDNGRIFSSEDVLSKDEWDFMQEVAEPLKQCVPCTGCRYCCEKCPAGLDIPRLLTIYNEIRFPEGMAVGKQLEALPKEGLPEACVKCGQCTSVCPQKIDVPAALSNLAECMKSV
ncbi:MAG: aldo/keto reductase [Lentisphaeria bacterium]|nr:aldo/keto reductase [Lentisphaeria bacterium]